MTPPLFVRNQETLRRKLRLSGVCEKNDADEIIDEAVLSVRGHFYRRLGQERVAELLAFAVSPTPTTPDEILRSVASSTEIKWVKLELTQSMPMLFMDGSNNALNVYNEEAPFRNTSAFEISNLQKRLFEQIEENLEMLKGSEQQGNEHKANTFDGTPDGEVCKPWDSIRVTDRYGYPRSH